MTSHPTDQPGRARQVVGWLLVVLAVLAATLALLSIWVFRTFTDTDLFVERVGSIIEEPEVAAAVSDAAATELVEGLALEDRVASVLPDPIAVVAGPLATATQEYLSRTALALVSSEGFQDAWAASLSAGHRASIAILEGEDTAAVQTADGAIVLDLTPVVQALVAERAEFLTDLLDRPVGEAGGSLGTDLGVDLPPDFGQVVLFESDNLAAAQAAYRSVTVAVWLAPVAALVLVAIAIAVSPRRWRAALAIVGGVCLLLVLVVVSLNPIQAAVVGAAADNGLGAAVGAAFDSLMRSLVNGVLVTVVLALLAVGLLALLSRRRSPSVAPRQQT